MEKSPVRWSDLPPELWPLIGKRLNTFIDAVRFRSVCRSWRASLPQLNASSLLSPLAVPCLRNTADRQFEDILLIRRIIYGLGPLHHHQTSNSAAASSSSSSSPRAAGGWLAKVQSTELGKMRFVRPLCTTSVKFRNEVFRKEVNLLDFRIHEVAKSYILGSKHLLCRFIDPAIIKVVVFPDSVWSDVKNCIIVAVHQEGKLGFTKHQEGNLAFTKHGDRIWTPICDQNFQFDDVIVYKGQIYTVDRQGTVFLIDSSMKLVQYSPPLGIFSNQKHLVECGGELYVVDRFLVEMPDFLDSDFYDESEWCLDNSAPTVVDFRVHRLDQERGRWVEVKELGNQAFVLGHDCFSVWAPDFEGFEGSCIYFSHELNNSLGFGYSTHVFDLEKKTIMKACAQIFRAPPIWLDLEATVLPSEAVDETKF